MIENSPSMYFKSLLVILVFHFHWYCDFYKFLKFCYWHIYPWENSEQIREKEEDGGGRMKYGTENKRWGGREKRGRRKARDGDRDPWKMEKMKQRDKQANILNRENWINTSCLDLCLNYLKWAIIKIYMEFKKLLLPKGTVYNLDLIYNFTKDATKQLLILIFYFFFYF